MILKNKNEQKYLAKFQNEVLDLGGTESVKTENV